MATKVAPDSAQSVVVVDAPGRSGDLATRIRRLRQSPRFVALLAFLTRWRVALLLVVATCAAFVYYLWGVDSWQFAFVGDEWPFYIMARAIAAHHLLVNPFDMHGVYGFNTMLGSYYQAIFLVIFGDTNFAWRLSNIVLIFPTSLCFYLWLRNGYGRQIALLATLLLQASAFAANYLKIGYVNAQALPLLVLCLYLASRCARSPTSKNAAWLGVALGVACYIYVGPLYPLFVAPTLLPLIAALRARHLTGRELLRAAAICAACYVVVLLPGILSLSGGPTAASKTSFSREYTDNWQMAVNVGHDFLLFYANYDYFYNHFIAGPYLDLISRIFATLGIAVALIAVVRRRSPHWLAHLKLLLTYTLVAVLIGVTSPYAYAATTRGIVFIPFGAAFAGVGLATLADWLRRLPIPAIALPRLLHRAYVASIVTLLVIVIWSVNIYQSQVGVFQRTGYSATGLIIGAIQQAHQRHERRVVLLLSPQFPYANYYYDQIPTIQQAYGVQDVFFIVQTPQQAAQAGCAMLAGAQVVYFQADISAAHSLPALPCVATSTADPPIALTPGYLL
ncbi:MAG: glycosyltransferase family 39 protein [Ktedonobacterales bacterium]